MAATRIAYGLGLLFFITSFVLLCVSFGTGYWYQSEGEDRLFTRLGLWEVCFNGYEHTSDYIGKAYYGCWWILHKEYAYVRGWIMPSWFISVQVLMTLGLVVGIIGLVVVPMAGGETETLAIQWIATGIAGLSWLCIGISVTVFGIMVGEDRTWMPRPDENKLGWSFGLAVVAGFMSAFSTIALCVFCVLRWYEMNFKDTVDYGFQQKPGPGQRHQQQYQHPMMPMVPKV